MNKRHNVSREDIFHLGPDGLLHFTGTHSNLQHQNQKGSSEFCIEAEIEEDYEDSDDFNYSESGSDYHYDSGSGTDDSEHLETCQNGYKESTRNNRVA